MARLLAQLGVVVEVRAKLCARLLAIMVVAVVELPISFGFCCTCC